MAMVFDNNSIALSIVKYSDMMAMEILEFR